jgi:hypothetical protein
MKFKVTQSLDGVYVWERKPWPFPTVNGQQTEQSRALQSNKTLHKPTPKDLTDIEEALL